MTKRRTRKKELVGWLEMQKADDSGKVTISVYKTGSSIYLNRHFRGGNFYEHLVHPAARGWLEEAATVWDDLKVDGSRFRSVVEGYPE